MGKINNFTDLVSWQECHKLVKMIYKFTKHFPSSEAFGITNQMRRAAVSITFNIAEGFGRQTYKEKVQFYSVALGSLTELQNQLIISYDINYLSQNHFRMIEAQYTVCQKLLCGLIKSTKIRIS